MVQDLNRFVTTRPNSQPPNKQAEVKAIAVFPLRSLPVTAWARAEGHSY
jgi:hypothetical protein